MNNDLPEGNIQSKAESLASDARNSISEYCYSECKAFCCRKGYLLLSKKEAQLIIGARMNQLIEEDILSVVNDEQYLLNIGAKDSCPRLKEFKCEIHKNNERPKACKEFPIFFWENKKIRLSEKCPGIKQGVFYKYLEELKELGYEAD